MLVNLSDKSSLLNQFVSEIRDKNIQKDSLRFRRNLERIGEIFAYEISKNISYKNKEVISPLGSIDMEVLNEQPVLATILRAGLPMHQGFLNYFDNAYNTFISAYRKYNKDGSFDIEMEYISSPDIEGKTLILIDPMLATGSSMVLTYKSLLEYGEPKHTYIVSAISSKEGINYCKRKLDNNKVSIWTAAIDNELTAKAFIVPGLGDAGDLAFGSKNNLD